MGDGPLWNGQALTAVNEACAEMEELIAKRGAEMVDSNLNAVLKKQTPYYRLQVRAKPDHPGWKVTDQGVIYGPWLEGIGSRNYPVTRFKGYSTFRRTAQQLQRVASDIGERVIVRFLPRMGGRP